MAMLMMRKLMKMIFKYDHDEYLPDVYKHLNIIIQPAR